MDALPNVVTSVELSDGWHRVRAFELTTGPGRWPTVATYWADEGWQVTKLNSIRAVKVNEPPVPAELQAEREARTRATSRLNAWVVSKLEPVSG
jgi:hypothetical protein